MRLVLSFVALLLSVAGSSRRRSPPTDATCPLGCACTAGVDNALERDGIVVSCSGASLTTSPGALPAAAVTLDLSGNRLTSLDDQTLRLLGEHSRSLTTANFSRNLIQSIDTGSFRTWSRLVSLDLSANRLASIDHGTFRGAAQTSLENLDLSGNRLTDVDGGFSGMANLERLDLRNNYLTSLTQFTFRDLSQLRYLFLTNNRIYRIDRRALRHLHHLLYLVLRGNPLADVQRLHFHTPSALSYIDVSECGLRAVPRGLPASLRYVQLRRNNLSALATDTFAEIRNVNILVLDENRISSVDSDVFADMSKLQQLWLNDNALTVLPRRLPASLRRLLVDNNNIASLDNTDTFSARAQLSSLSLAGNQISHLSPQALVHLSNLQSLDLSNNQLQQLAADTFSGSSHLRSLSLAKNSLTVFHRHAFTGLRALKSLTLSYVPSDVVQLSADELWDSLPRLTRLDLDNSPGVAAAVFQAVRSGLDEVETTAVEELGLTNSDLTTLGAEFRQRFARLKELRLSSSRWHCDRRLLWLRDWLLDQQLTVRVQSRPEIRCATPDSLTDRPLVSLNDHEFVAVTSTSSGPSTPSTSPSHGTSRSSTVPPATRFSGPRYPNPTDIIEQHQLTDTDSSSGDPHKPVARSTEGPASGAGTGLHLQTATSSSTSSSTRRDVPTSDGTAAARAAARTSKSPHHRPGHHSHRVSHARHSDEEEMDRFKVRLIIAVATVGATIVIAAFIVAGIIVIWRRSREFAADDAKSKLPPAPLTPPLDDDGSASLTPRTFIKYKNKNGVLYFSTPASPDAPSLLTTDPDDLTTTDSCLIGETTADGTGTIRYVLPPSSAGLYKTRVYRWEDF